MVFPDEQTEYTNQVLRLVGETIDPTAPSLWAYEIRNTLLMGIKRGRITRDRAQKLLGFIADLHVDLIDPVSYDAIFEAAHVYRITVYDAAYLELAHRIHAPLGSLDNRLRSAAVKAGVAVHQT